MTAHTAGPLTIDGNLNIKAGDAQFMLLGTTTPLSPGARQDEAEANSARLVACWNACEGMTTESVEDLTNIGGVKQLDQGVVVQARVLRDMRRQRDELLAALEGMVGATASFCEGGYSQNADAAHEQARATMAKAKSGASTATPQHFTSITKGGSYERLGAIRGAGQLKGLAGIAYRDTTTGGLFIRTPECFAARMKVAGADGGAV